MPSFAAYTLEGEARQWRSVQTRNELKCLSAN